MQVTLSTTFAFIESSFSKPSDLDGESCLFLCVIFQLTYKSSKINKYQQINLLVETENIYFRLEQDRNVKLSSTF